VPSQPTGDGKGGQPSMGKGSLPVSKKGKGKMGNGNGGTNSPKKKAGWYRGRRGKGKQKTRSSEVNNNNSTDSIGLATLDLNGTIGDEKGGHALIYSEEKEKSDHDVNVELPDGGRRRRLGNSMTPQEPREAIR